MTLSRRPLRPS